MWWDSRLPGTYNVMDHGQVDFGGGSEVSHAEHGGALHGHECREPARPARGRARRPLHAHGTAGDDRARLGPARRRADLRRALAGPGAARAPGRPRRGDAGERRHRAGRDDPLARHRRAERRGRGRRGDAGRGPAGRALRLPLPRRAGRHVLVPHASGVLEGGSARALRRDRHRARRRDAVRPRPRGPRPHVRRHPHPRRQRRDRSPRRPCRDARPPATREHRQLSSPLRARPERRSRSSRSTAPT